MAPLSNGHVRSTTSASPTDPLLKPRARALHDKVVAAAEMLTQRSTCPGCILAPPNVASAVVHVHRRVVCVKRYELATELWWAVNST
jgi:hypothetical protein